MNPYAMNMNMMNNNFNNLNLYNNINNMNNINQFQNQHQHQMNHQFNPSLNQMNNNIQLNQNNIQMPMNMNNNFMNNPYQRIIELENIIKLKDLEIKELKMQLAQKNCDNFKAPYFLKEKEFTTLKFRVIPSDNSQNEFHYFEKAFKLKKKFIEIKKWVAKKLNKDFDKLFFECDKILIRDDDILTPDYSGKIILIKENLKEEDYNTPNDQKGEIYLIKFNFTPSNSQMNIANKIKFTEKFNSCEKIIKLKIRISKKLKKNLNHLLFTYNNVHLYDDSNIFEQGILPSGPIINIIEKDRIIDENDSYLDEDKDEIIDKNKYNLMFYNDNKFLKNYMVSGSCPIGLTLLLYALNNLNRVQIMSLLYKNNHIYFRYYQTKLDVFDNTKVGRIIINEPNPKIDLIILGDLL